MRSMNLLYVLFLAVALGVVACGGSTTMEQTWKSPTMVPNNLHNVVAVYISKDPSMRRTVEDSMVQRLTKEGVHATPAYSILSSDELQDQDRAKAKLLAAGYDGVVAM